jgi:tRNA 2-selenouridine synthase
MQYIDAAVFLDSAGDHTVIDVRSPSEFRQGHIPGAFNLPLFDDEERRRIGTLYHDSGKDASVLLGLDLVGPKMSRYVKQAQKLVKGKQMLMHCWRGGLRSSSMAWLLELAGFRIKILQGGYKAYRAFIRRNIGSGYELVVLGGKTGSGKSEILRQLDSSGEQILDLEKIACHKGSAFGHLGQQEQPTNEQFENNLFSVLHSLNPAKPVWLEDESRSIGIVSLPDLFIDRMKASPLIYIETDKESRIRRLVSDYAGYDPEFLDASVQRISSRLGSLNTKLVTQAIRNRNFEDACRLLLNYYDKLYMAGIQARDQSRIFVIKPGSGNPETIAVEILAFHNRVLNATQANDVSKKAI